MWVAIFGFIGNYFWTHYFFNLLGAAYTLPSHKLNGVSRAGMLWVCTAGLASGHVCVRLCSGHAIWGPLLPCTHAGAAGHVPHDARVFSLLPRGLKHAPASSEWVADSSCMALGSTCSSSWLACITLTCQVPSVRPHCSAVPAGPRLRATWRARRSRCASWRARWPCSCSRTPPPTWRR